MLITNFEYMGCPEKWTVDSDVRKCYTFLKTDREEIIMAGRGRKTLAQKIQINKAEQIKCEERLTQLKEEEKLLFLQVIEESGVSVEEAIKAIQSVSATKE